METVSWQYARRRRHLEIPTPYRYRWHLLGGIYIPSNIKATEPWAALPHEINLKLFLMGTPELKAMSLRDLARQINSNHDALSYGAWLLIPGKTNSDKAKYVFDLWHQ